MITDAEKLRAIKISQAIQEWFDVNRENRSLRSTEVYEILARKSLVERDRHNGIKFREFLKKLKANHALDLIPQCRVEQKEGNFNNWYFESTPSKTVKQRNLIPISKIHAVKSLDLEAIAKGIDTFPKRDVSDFGFIELKARKNYPRAYEFWSNEEYDLLFVVAKEVTDSYELSKLFKRQPSVIQNKLKEKFGVVI